MKLKKISLCLVVLFTLLLLTGCIKVKVKVNETTNVSETSTR